MATIPIAADVAALVGPFGEKIENRSLLLDRFSFHKSWPEELDAEGKRVKWDDASRWSFVRIADGAAGLLQREASEKDRRAGGRNVEDHNRERMARESQTARQLANIAWDRPDLARLRAEHTKRFLSLFRRSHGPRASITLGQLEGRLAINISGGLIRGAGICLDRLFGMPYIPGSAVKGVCRHEALAELKAATSQERARIFEDFRSVFGTADCDFQKDGVLVGYTDLLDKRPPNVRGQLSFLPAYPFTAETKIVVDLTNVHYPEYYKSGDPAAQSIEKPLPNSFPCVETGAQFAFCLVLNRPDASPALLVQANRWLRSALTVRGLGAKTSSGYGWFSIQDEALAKWEQTEAAQAAKAAQEAQEAANKAAEEEERNKQLATMSPEEREKAELILLPPDAFSAVVKDLATRPELTQRSVIALLKENKEKRERWKNWSKDGAKGKPALKSAVEAVCKTLGIPLP